MEKKGNISVEKGKSYICIKDWHQLGTSFTKGKVYVCHKDNCMYDDFGAEKASVGELFLPAIPQQIRDLCESTTMIRFDERPCEINISGDSKKVIEVMSALGTVIISTQDRKHYEVKDLTEENAKILLEHIKGYLKDKEEQSLTEKKKASDVLSYLEELDTETVIGLLHPYVTDAQLSSLYDRLVSEGILREI